jgi:tRNA(Ile)-lysidine synthase
MLKHTKSGAQISKTALKTHPLVVAEVIKRAYNMCGEFADLESKHIDMIVEFYNTCKNGAVLNLPHGVVCEKRDGLLLYKLQAENIDECKFVLGDNVLPNGKTIVVSRITDFEFQDGKYYVDDDRLPSNLVWRTRRPGDVFGKLGSGKKKLNDYFTDKKIALPMRDKIILLASGSNILLVVGYDIAESVKVDHKTGLVLEIDCTQIM